MQLGGCRGQGAAIAAASIILFAAPSAARSAVPTEPVDLLSQANVRLEGNPKLHSGGIPDEASVSAAPAGDVNGDGIADVIVGAPGARLRPGREGAGAAFVVFGQRELKRVNLSLLGNRGFTIVGAPGDAAGGEVAGIGDFNGDGFGDVVVVAAEADGTHRSIGRRTQIDGRGVAYVVFGRSSTKEVDLSALRDRGFYVKGVRLISAAGAGDVNGDGRPDLVIGDGDGDDGRAYVLFGGTSGNLADIERLGARGFRIDGASGDLTLGSAVDGAGDVNGDGLADVVIGAENSLGRPIPPAQRGVEFIGSGAAYVVFGQRSTRRISLDRLGTGGFRMDGPGLASQAGWAVAGAGDVNGDGRADVIVGAPFFPVSFKRERLGPGSAYVVFGANSSQRLALAQLGSRGFRVAGTRSGDQVGAAVAGAGDVNGDGLADLLVGAPRTFSNGSEGDSSDARGSAYVVFGQRSAATLPLAAVDAGGAAGRGFRLDGTPGDSAGSIVAAGGDVDADGHRDLLVASALTCSPGGDGPSLLVYLYGPGGVPAATESTGTAGPDRIEGTGASERISAFAGNDFVRGNGGGDCLFGDAGADRLYGGSGRDSLYGGDGNDYLNGGASRDLLLGGPGSDRIVGGTGADSIEAGPGSDVVSGGDGPDEIDGGSGNDQLSGGTGQDRLRGGSGNDTLLGGRGDDSLNGGTGQDRLVGGSGNDSLDGGEGSDVIVGGSGSDVLTDDEGGRDRFEAGAGNDLIDSMDGRREIVDCGSGRDKVLADRSDVLRHCEVRLKSPDDFLREQGATIPGQAVPVPPPPPPG